MFISMMFAGHHTTSGTAAWTLIELLRHPDELGAVDAELDELYAGGAEVSYQALREMPRLESAIKEALRLHPPLILLLRVAKEDLEVDGFAITAGQMVGASPAVSNRIAEDFPDPDAFEPGPLPRAPRGGPVQPVDLDPLRRRAPPLRGRRLRHDAAEGHLLGAPAGLGVRAGPTGGHLPQRPLEDGGPAPAALRGAVPAQGRSGTGRSGGSAPLMRVSVDLDLCQGHGVCESEAPDVFALGKQATVTVLDATARRGDRRRGRGRRPLLPARAHH